MGTSVPDPTGQITLVGTTQVALQPGYYLITYHVSSLLGDEGYMQVTPSYNGEIHIEYGVYAKTGAGKTSAEGSASLIVPAPSPTVFTLTYNSNVSSTDGAMTMTVLQLQRSI